MQEPQSSVAAQPSETVPQFLPRLAQVPGVHGLVPHRLAPPPPQVWPAGQAPHWSVPPQPSASVPQSLPSLAQVTAVQPPSGFTSVVVGRHWQSTKSTLASTTGKNARMARVLSLERPGWSRDAKLDGK
jgi:hypothetical protein